MAKKESEIVEILEAFDLTRCVWSTARLAGCDPKTVQRYVDRRDAGRYPFQRSRRTRVVDPFLEKIDELVERSRGKIHADIVHRRLVAMGFSGDERTTRRAVAQAKATYEVGRRRVYRPPRPTWSPQRLFDALPVGVVGSAPRAHPAPGSAPALMIAAPPSATGRVVVDVPGDEERADKDEAGGLGGDGAVTTVSDHGDAVRSARAGTVVPADGSIDPWSALVRGRRVEMGASQAGGPR